MCVLETQWCSLVSLILEGYYIWTVNNSVDQLHSFHSINQIKTIVTVQIFELELVNITGIENEIYLSTATARNVLPSYNGTYITCVNGGDQINTAMTSYVQEGEKITHVQHHLHLHPSI